MEVLEHLKKFMLYLFIAVGMLYIAAIGFQAYHLYTYKDINVLKRFGVKKPIKVFQIGFSKCGTTSLMEFFNNNGVPSVHHAGGRLAITIYDNYLNGLPLISPEYQQFIVFLDMERIYDNPPIAIGPMLFRELDKQYPGSKFILNTRDKQAWLKSRSKHPAYEHNMRWLDLSAKLLNKTPAEVLEQWSQEWDDHHAAVLEYFKDRPKDLLVFNIETDDPQKLCDFFREYLLLHPAYYRHVNKSAVRDKRYEQQQKNFVKAI